MLYGSFILLACPNTDKRISFKTSKGKIKKKIPLFLFSPKIIKGTEVFK